MTSGCVFMVQLPIANDMKYTFYHSAVISQIYPLYQLRALLNIIKFNRALNPASEHCLIGV